MRGSQAVGELGCSAAYRVPKGDHQLITRGLGRFHGRELVAASHSNQDRVPYEALDDLCCRLNISNGWYGDNNGIRLMPFHRYQPVPHREIWS